MNPVTLMQPVASVVPIACLAKLGTSGLRASRQAYFVPLGANTPPLGASTRPCLWISSRPRTCRPSLSAQAEYRARSLSRDIDEQGISQSSAASRRLSSARSTAFSLSSSARS